MTAYWCEHAWVGPGDVVDGLLVDVVDSHITATTRLPFAPPGAIRLAGLTIPGLANCHSHAFHRALRSRTQRERGSFWTWRETMYSVAAGLNPDTYYALAYATYREMALAGITAVGEFHYLHYDTGGAPYADPNAMGRALIAAAHDAGLRITLLDTCYLSAGFGAPPEGTQLRFSDGTVSAWVERTHQLDDVADPGVVLGAAIHSVRAVPRDDLATVARARPTAPLHVHLSEQVAENDACLEHYGCTPAELLAASGVLDGRVTAVHATHLTGRDVSLLGDASCYAGFCPTTERDLADGIGASRALHDAGAVLTLGTDSHAVIDMHEEMRAVELDERLSTQRRGHWRAGELLVAATANGQRSLGFDDAGRIAPGYWADLVTLDDRSVRTAGAGTAEESAVFAATASDVVSVVAGGELLPHEPDTVSRLLEQSIDAVVTP